MKDNNIIKVLRESNWVGGFRLEYDGKYITLFGLDKEYKQFHMRDEMDHAEERPEDVYEEMVLDACVVEIRNASPKIDKVTDAFIFISLNVNKET